MKIDKVFLLFIVVFFVGFDRVQNKVGKFNPGSHMPPTYLGHIATGTRPGTTLRHM